MRSTEQRIMKLQRAAAQAFLWGEPEAVNTHLLWLHLPFLQSSALTYYSTAFIILASDV